MLESFWRNWAQRDQARIDGEIPDAVREHARWDRELDEHGRERLVFGALVLSDAGVKCHGLSYTWDEVAYLTYENRGRGLMICVRGARYLVHPFHGFRHMWLTMRICRALLEDCEPFVQAHGSQVYAGLDVPSLWWARQPESQATAKDD